MNRSTGSGTRDERRERAKRGSLVGCIAGALSFSEYRESLAAAGLTDVDITPTHAVADRTVSATIHARRP